MNPEVQRFNLWEWVKAIATLVLVCVVAYKIYVTPTTLTIDFPTLLSLLLALFSVALSALFYFKATDTSNTFYDNTYKFTRDIAQLLVKIESGFGERLRHLDEGYSSMRTYLQNTPSRQTDDVERTKRKLETEQQEVEKVVAERNAIIKTLVERSELQEEQKKKFLAEIEEKERQLSQLQHEVNRLNKRLVVDRLNQRSEREGRADVDSDLPPGFADYTYERVVRKIGVRKLMRSSSPGIRRLFSSLMDGLPNGYIEDLEKFHLFDSSGLTLSGIRFLREIASRRVVDDGVHPEA